MTLEEAFEAAGQLYREWTRSEVTRDDVAAGLGLSSTSSTFRQKVFTLRQYGLLTENDSGDRFRVAMEYLDLRDHTRGEPAFRDTALKLLKNADAYTQVLAEFEERLPSAEVLGKRLERQSYTPERGQEVAQQLITSVRWAGIIDEENLFLTSRAERSGNGIGPDSAGRQQVNTDGTDERRDEDPIVNPPKDSLRLEVPTADGSKVVVLYPASLSATDADRVGTVLRAIAGIPS